MAMALYLPQIRKFTTYTDENIKKYILEVGGEMNCTVMFLNDSATSNILNTKNGRNKKALVIPRRAVNTEVLQQIDKRKY